MAKDSTIYYKTEEEIELIRTSCLLVCKALAEVGRVIRPGISGLEIDTLAEQVIRDHGAIPSFKGYGGTFPATLCVSVNEVVVHGIPTQEQIFQEGDVVSVDCGAYLNGYHGDSAYTFALGEPAPEVIELLQVTYNALYRGIDMARTGKRLGDVSHAIQHYAERAQPRRYGVVRELVGHGIGRELHEAPEVPNYGKRGRGIKLQTGLVIAIEPMINLGRKEVRTHTDGWTVYAKDLQPSAHYEHTVAVRPQGPPDILSDHSLIEEQLAQNDHVHIVRPAGMLAG